MSGRNISVSHNVLYVTQLHVLFFVFSDGLLYFSSIDGF